MDIGKNIKKTRKKKGLTQKQLGDVLGVSAAMIAQYETGKRQPKYETLKKIADALNVSVSSLYDVPDSVDFSLVEDNENKPDPVRLFSGFYGIESFIGSLDEEFLARLNKLNNKGKSKAIEQVELLTKIPEYRTDYDTSVSDQPDSTKKGSETDGSD